MARQPWRAIHKLFMLCMQKNVQDRIRLRTPVCWNSHMADRRELMAVLQNKHASTPSLLCQQSPSDLSGEKWSVEQNTEKWADVTASWSILRISAPPQQQ